MNKSSPAHTEHFARGYVVRYRAHPRLAGTLRYLAVAALAMLWSAPVWAQRGAITVPRNLGELLDESAYVVRGRVVGARVEPHPQLRATTVVVTIDVTQSLKGPSGKSFTFRQFIWDFRDRQDAAGYRKGQELLLLMLGENTYGLSSPAGLEQGRFRIVRDASGHTVAINGYGNASLFRGLNSQIQAKGIHLKSQLAARVALPSPGAMDADDLVELIRQLLGAK